MYVLVINPGSTSTKLAIYNNRTQLIYRTFNHRREELLPFQNILEQKEFRKRIVTDVLKEHGFHPEDIDLFVGRGGLVRHLKSGVYRINDSYIQDASIGLNGDHASNLGGILAWELAKDANKEDMAYTVDPVVVDECEPIARISGMPEISRVGAFHALNQKAVAYRYAAETGKSYSSLRLIVAHLGGGISVGTHRDGRIIDVNSALGGDGPFSPERVGRVPCNDLLNLCFSGKYTYEQLKTKLIGEGGIFGYLGTKDIRDVEQQIANGNQKAKEVLEAMAYQIAKEIASCSAVLNGWVDAIIITGGIAHSCRVVDLICERISFITPNIIIYPGEDEMFALADGALTAIEGHKKILKY
ncbi:butyrate kinase [Enterobacter bugandensis]|uniref:butyrate kinase n=1 Tax=Enterobacter bugandensis TaxID=881260 RepID=UPI00200403FD|nr:butyrate kinase [Enterobacter bugandensis]MCK6879983.1 butyrate kinase [Enterobacter bugandensis]